MIKAKGGGSFGKEDIETSLPYGGIMRGKEFRKG